MLQSARGTTTVLVVGIAAIAMYVFRRRFQTSTQKWMRCFASVASGAVGPPVLPKRPHYVPFGKVEGENRGANPWHTIVYLKDDYFYVRDDTRKNKEVIHHLEQENAYTESKMSHLKELREELYAELLSHIQETYSSYPYPYGPFEYFTKTEKGSSYSYHCRKNKAGDESVILDENELAKGKKHCDVGSFKVSPDHNLLAYSVDFDGYETYELYIKDLTTGELLMDRIPNMTGSVQWGADNSVLYYTTFDKAHRSNKVWKHVLNTPLSQDECLYTEDDELYRAGMYKTQSGDFLILGSSSSETSEYYFIDLREPNAELKCIEPRQKGVTYHVDHHDGDFYIVTNRNEAVNFKVMKTPIHAPSGSNWIEVFPYDSAIRIDGVDCFKDFMVVYGRQYGFTQIWCTSYNEKVLTGKRLKFPEDVYTVTSSVNKEYETESFRFSYSSLTTPVSTFEYNVKAKKMVLLRERPCPNYDRTLYETKRFEATSSDGTVIPMSAVYRKDLRKEGPGPIHLYGYGSYEICIDPDFSSSVLPLLNRGVMYVIAHIRGGGEQGRAWYEDAKYLNKRKTFDDFIACAEHLVDQNMTTPSLLSIEGRSAGGLLMGAVLNERPDLFQAAIAGVPFVDVMNSMSDSTIPLTTGEWEEWGNPNEKKFFEYMLSYSPYENVVPQAYPHMLVTSGLYDPRVAYWEPTKWVAKLREMKTDSNDILLKMDLSSGHFSASDRYRYLREKAYDIAFLLDRLQLLSKKDEEPKDLETK